VVFFIAAFDSVEGTKISPIIIFKISGINDALIKGDLDI